MIHIAEALSRRTLVRGIAAAVLAGSVALAGCTTGTGAAPLTDEARDPADLKLAFVYATSTLNPMQEMAFGVTAAAAEQGAEVALSAPSGTDGPAQVQLFQQAQRTATDGIVFETLTPDLFPRPLKQATDAGVPVIAVDTVPPGGSGVTTHVGSSDLEIGSALGERLVVDIPSDAQGSVVIGTAIPGLGVLDARAAGMKAAVEAARPGLTVVGPLATAPEPTGNHAAWTAIIRSNPDAVAFLGTGAQDAVSLGQLQGTDGRSYVAGAADLDPGALQALQAGRLNALASPEHWLKGYIAMELLIRQATGEEPMPEGSWDSGFLVVDETNAAEIAQRQQDEATRLAWFQTKAEEQLADPSQHLKPLH